MARAPFSCGARPRRLCATLSRDSHLFIETPTLRPSRPIAAFSARARFPASIAGVPRRANRHRLVCLISPLCHPPPLTPSHPPPAALDRSKGRPMPCAFRNTPPGRARTPGGRHEERPMTTILTVSRPTSWKRSAPARPPARWPICKRAWPALRRRRGFARALKEAATTGYGLIAEIQQGQPLARRSGPIDHRRWPAPTRTAAPPAVGAD